MLGRFRGLLSAHEENARLREELAVARRRLRDAEGSGDAYRIRPIPGPGLHDRAAP